MGNPMNSRLPLVLVTALVALALAGCSRIIVDSKGERVAVRSVVDCGVSKDGMRRWRVLELRSARTSRLRFEQSVRGANGAWQALGSAVFDPAENERGPHAFNGLRCVVEDGGVRVNSGVDVQRGRDGYHLEVFVSENFRVDFTVIVVG
jgi:hypothetical protein